MKVSFLSICFLLMIPLFGQTDSCKVIRLYCDDTTLFVDIHKDYIYHLGKERFSPVRRGLILDFDEDSIKFQTQYSGVRDYEKQLFTNETTWAISDIGRVYYQKDFFTYGDIYLSDSISFQFINKPKSECYSKEFIPINDKITAIKTIEYRRLAMDTVYWLDGRVFDAKRKSIADLKAIYNRRHPTYDSTFRAKAPVALLPSKTDRIDGLALSFYPTNNKNTKDFLTPRHPLKINGILLDSNPIAVGTAFFQLFTFNWFLFQENDEWMFNRIASAPEDMNAIKLTTVNGISLSTGQMSAMKINGLNITTSSVIYGFNGLSIAPFQNIVSTGNGIQISGIYNYATHFNGIQIGLFNTSHNLKGIQIGLWNKNQKRSLPLINWNF